MKPVLHNPKYILAIGLTVIVCITGIVFFISRLQDERITGISELAATNVYRQKAGVLRYEFNQLLKSTADAGSFIAQTRRNERWESVSAESTNRDVASLLFADPRVKSAWYAFIKPGDTSFVYLVKRNDGYDVRQAPAYLKTWIRERDGHPDTSDVAESGLFKAADSLHWLTLSRVGTATSGQLILGLDISLQDFQQSFYNVDAQSFAYAFILDNEGVCVSHPDVMMIGKQMGKVLHQSSSARPSRDKYVHFSDTISEYLAIPVTRYYMPSGITGTGWTIIVDVPRLLLGEDVEAIHTYSIYLGLIAVAIILGLIWLYVQKWQKEIMLRGQIEINKAQQEQDHAMMQLDKLKEKVDPHFLFNSLSSLNALIDQQPKLAQSFVVKLSRVYRYVLEPSPTGLATVAEELRFAEEYFFLMKIRFGDALPALDIRVWPADLPRKLPFMSLQTLIENAVKHNMLSKQKPLQIVIESDGNQVVVSNNLQLRNDIKHSGKQGLNYLKSTYVYYGNKRLRCGAEGAEYKCYLPLL